MNVLEPFEKRKFIQHGYWVDPAINGGFVVRDRRGPDLISAQIAFSNHRDLMAWLNSAHDELASPPPTDTPSTRKE